MLVCTYFTVAIMMFGQKHDTFVIVHGAWGGSWSFKQVDAIMTAKGYNVYRPNLTGLGERVHLASPEINLNTHILDVVNTVLYENLHDIILVGHSYGGMIITGVADSIPERIKKLIYLDAFVPNDGESVFTVLKNSFEAMSQDGFIIPVWVNENHPLPHDVPHPLKTLTQPASLSNMESLSLPATYILTVDEGKIPENDDFFFFSERARERGWKTIIMTADHNPQQTKVNELVELLIKNI